MKVTMLQTVQGSEDGVIVQVYREGEQYDLSATDRALDLAAVFLREGWAVEEGVATPEEPVSQDLVPEAQPRPGKRGRR